MNNKQHSRIVGIALLALSVALAYWGYREGHSYSGQLMRMLAGSPSEFVLRFYASASISFLLGFFWLIK